MLLVEPTAYSIRLSRPKKQGCGKKKQVEEASQVTATYSQPGEEKDYARTHGCFRGARNANDALTPVGDPPFSEDDESKGAYLFAQATSCRRQVIRTVFVNPPPRLCHFLSPFVSFIVSHTLSEPTVPCCDICDPSLLDLVRPGPRPTSTTKKLAYSKHPNLLVVSALREWRCKTLINDNHPCYLPASYILSEEAINKLASLSPCTELSVKVYLSQQWVFWSTYGSDVTATIASSQLQFEKIVPSPATNTQDEDREESEEGLSAVHSSRAATQHGKRRRSCSPIDVPFSSTDPGSRRQKRVRRAVPHMPNSCNATVKSPSLSQSQPSHHRFSQPIMYSNNTAPESSKLDASPAPPHSFPPPQLPVPSQYHLHSMHPNALLDPHSKPHSPYQPRPSSQPWSQPVTSTPSRSLPIPIHPNSPYQPRPSSPSQPWSQPVTSTPSHSRHTPAHPSLSPHSRTLSYSQHIRRSNIHHPPYYSIPIPNPTVSSLPALQLRTPTAANHHRSPTSTPTPNTSRLHPQIFGISSPHSPFCSSLATVIASSSGGAHTATYQHQPASQFREPVTPSEPPLPPSQYHQHVPPSGYAHPAMPQFGLFTPFPSPHPMVPPDKIHNNWNFSVR